MPRAAGVVAFARPDWNRADLIPHRKDRTLRVVHRLQSGDDQLPVLVVELAQ
jgi:hypothetical protein